MALKYNSLIKLGLVSAPDNIGFVDYNNAIGTTSISSNTWVDLPNDGLGAFTNRTYLPSGITDLMDVNTGYLDLTQLKNGDSILLRNDFVVIPNGNRANLNFRYSLGTGVSTYTLEQFVGRLDSGAGIPYRFNLYSQLIYLGDDNTRLNPIKLQINLSKNGSFINNGTAIQILRK